MAAKKALELENHGVGEPQGWEAKYEDFGWEENFARRGSDLPALPAASRGKRSEFSRRAGNGKNGQEDASVGHSEAILDFSSARRASGPVPTFGSGSGRIDTSLGAGGGCGTVIPGGGRERSPVSELTGGLASLSLGNNAAADVCVDNIQGLTALSGLGTEGSAASNGPGEQHHRTARCEDSWVCAICHNMIQLAETAQVKGCEHPYCANCILQWCSYKTYPWCPQCRTPFDALLLFKMLDGSLSDVMVEESVCLLLRAPWYTPVEVHEVVEVEEDFPVGEEDYDDDEYFRSNLRIGNRRWGENGYVRGGRMQARVAVTPSPGMSSGRRAGGARASGNTSAAAKSGSPSVGKAMGRRAKRAQRREDADKEMGSPAHVTHQQPTDRLRQADRQAGRIVT